MTNRANDPVWAMFFLYFSPCDVFQRHMEYLKPAFFGGAQDKVGREFAAFTIHWFASLFVVCEGWKTLKLSDPEVDKLMPVHLDKLRLARNGVYHYQPDDRKHRQFFELDTINWAVQLHVALKRFFAARGYE